jgi:putative membrane protein
MFSHRYARRVGLAAVLGDSAAPSWTSLFGNWSLDPLFAVAVLSGVAYFTGVRRLGQRGRAWPIGRSFAFAFGLALIVVATESGIARFDRSYFSIHVVQHLCLGMIAPLFLVLGAPVTLALQSSRRRTQERWLRVLHSRAIGFITHPMVVWVLFGSTLVILYFTGLFELSLEHGWVHVLVHVHFVVVGCLFMAYVVGIDPVARPLGYGMRLLFVAVVLPFHAFLGVALLGSNRVLAAGWYEATSGRSHASLLNDQRLGAGILWTFGELFGLAALSIVLYQWMRHEAREGIRLDRRLDAERARATVSATRSRP